MRNFAFRKSTVGRYDTGSEVIAVGMRRKKRETRERQTLCDCTGMTQPDNIRVEACNILQMNNLKRVRGQQDKSLSRYTRHAVARPGYVTVSISISMLEID